jgi:hypothetical protein
LPSCLEGEENAKQELTGTMQTNWLSDYFDSCIWHISKIQMNDAEKDL